MTHRALVSVFVGVSLIAFASFWAAPAAPQTAAPRTSWGDPDLRGIWTTDAEILVPFERPAEFGALVRKYAMAVQPSGPA